MKLLGCAVAASLVLAMAGPAVAQSESTKAGVDAWQQGDYAKAVEIWRPLAAAGEPDAQFNMGQAYKLGRGVPVDMPVAMEWFRKAAARGHLRAEDNLGLLLFQQNRREEAMPYLERSAARGEARAQYLLGTAHYNGDLAEKDWVKAYALMTRSAASGLPQAANSLALMDKYVPEDQRSKGLALAAQMAQTQDQAKVAAIQTPAAPAPARTLPTPVRTTDVPPSASSNLPQGYTPSVPAPVAAAPKPGAPVAQASPVAPPAVTPQPAPKPAPAAPVVPKPAPPAPKPAPAAPAVAASGDWRVQLGAFGEEGNARKLWAQLTGRIASLKPLQPYLVKGGNVTRLQAGPFATEAEAGRMCAKVKAAGNDCLVKHK